MGLEHQREYRSGATRDNMFPPNRHGKLDLTVLKRLGLSKERMLEEDGAPDALFFHQLILPIHQIDPKHWTGIPSTVKDDPRLPFYNKVSKWSNLYALSKLDLGGGYGELAGTCLYLQTVAARSGRRLSAARG